MSNHSKSEQQKTSQDFFFHLAEDHSLPRELVQRGRAFTMESEKQKHSHPLLGISFNGSDQMSKYAKPKPTQEVKERNPDSEYEDSDDGHFFEDIPQVFSDSSVSSDSSF